MAKDKETKETVEETTNAATEEQVVDTAENSDSEVDNDAELEEEVEELTAEEKLQVELAEAKDKYLRLYSEFENFRRRNAKERIELVKTASADLMTDLLPTIDDFERANQANEKQDDVDSLKEGFSLIHNKIYKTLEGKGLKVMETKKGTDFDADLHEAVTQFPVEEKKLKGKIIDTVEKGYYLGDKVIRFAKVVIGS
ncbi:nucleotide exchange factor GrpE [Roseivirga misakiensis]|uniref:Protein GrpE n=1 Tax=Roseivirga misakiensis TaxID=1563681 RepID=A0A1E5T5G0_9BACT|nr:nucleotide exchange factor GrpE [Roseivirga misakiensis]OEK06603.1 nucleotide exchange factor GrpE [Roseivirga misakiensis]